MQNKAPPKKYYSVWTYVDVDTGELLLKSDYERNYYKIKIETSYEHSEKYIIIKKTVHCKENGQTRLDL